MRLLYIANLRLPTEKAYGINIAEMCRAFADNGLDVALVFPYRRSPHKKVFSEYYGVKNNFKAKMIPAVDFYFPGKLDRISVAIKNFLSGISLACYGLFSGADTIYSRDELPLFLLSFFRDNLCFEAHRFSSKRALFYNRFKKIGIKTVVISAGLEKEFINFGFKENNILVAPDGVNLKEFDIDMEKERARSELSLPRGGRLVGYVGSFTTLGMKKGLDILFEALSLIKEANVKLLLIGSSVNPADVEYYKKLAENFGIKDRVIFVGQVSHSLVPLYLKGCDVLVMPFPNLKHYSVYMSPLKLFEYMASRRPIVATDLPSVREVLNDKNSILAKPDDADSSAQGIRRVLDDNMLGDELAKKAREDVENYTWAKRAKNILNFTKKTA